MELKPTSNSLDLVRKIAENVQTFHHHHHILYDIAETFKDKPVNYLEIGAFAGASSCLMLSRKKTNVISIDLGEPIPKITALENVLNHKIDDFRYKYIQANSQTLEAKQLVLNELATLGHLGYGNKLQLLFIDGDHALQGVLNDFNLYSDLVEAGGFIVFDDYRDSEYSPEVRVAVDSLIPNIEADYDIIGTFENHLEAHPSDFKEGNCFVIQKKKL